LENRGSAKAWLVAEMWRSSAAPYKRIVLDGLFQDGVGDGHGAPWPYNGVAKRVGYYRGMATGSSVCVGVLVEYS
jgi:hypothetical protein